MWGPSHYRTWLVYSNDEPPQTSYGSSWARKLDAPPLVPLESFPKLICASVAWNPYSSHHIYLFFEASHTISIIWLSLAYDCPHWCEPFTPFSLPPPPYSLFAILSVNFLAYAHPLHECSKCQKGVDQLDLYLAIGLGTSLDKIPKETKCETLVDTILNIKSFLSRISLSPFLHANTIWRHSSHGQRELLHPLFLCFLFQC